MGLVMTNYEYWQKFYQNPNRLLSFPTQFSIHIHSQLNEKVLLLDLGAGNLRDSNFFATQGHQVLAVDQQSEVLQIMGTNFGIETFVCDFADLGSLTELYNRVQLLNPNRVVIYGRFLLHALNDSELETLFKFVVLVVKRFNAMAFFEFRGKEDTNLPKNIGNHSRNFIDIKSLGDLIVPLGLRFEYIRGGLSMANYMQEDPFVYRVKIV